MTDHLTLPAGALVVSPEQGRTYDMGFMPAVFKAGGEETRERYSLSEWWMEPRTAGPGAHRHEHKPQDASTQPSISSSDGGVRAGDEPAMSRLDTAVGQAPVVEPAEPALKILSARRGGPAGGERRAAR